MIFEIYIKIFKKKLYKVFIFYIYYYFYRNII